MSPIVLLFLLNLLHCSLYLLLSLRLNNPCSVPWILASQEYIPFISFFMQLFFNSGLMTFCSVVLCSVFLSANLCCLVVLFYFLLFNNSFSPSPGATQQLCIFSLSPPDPSVSLMTFTPFTSGSNSPFNLRLLCTCISSASILHYKLILSPAQLMHG